MSAKNGYTFLNSKVRLRFAAWEVTRCLLFSRTAIQFHVWTVIVICSEFLNLDMLGKKGCYLGWCPLGEENWRTGNCTTYAVSYYTCIAANLKSTSREGLHMEAFCLLDATHSEASIRKTKSLPLKYTFKQSHISFITKPFWKALNC